MRADGLYYPASCRKTAGISSLIPGRLSDCDWRCTCVTCETSLHLLHASSRSPIPGISARPPCKSRRGYVEVRAKNAPLTLPFFSVSLASATLSIPLPFPRSVCTASINIYNETRSSDCTPLPIWPESLARDSWPTSGDIHKARTLSEHPDARSRVYSPNVRFMGLLMRYRLLPTHLRTPSNCVSVFSVRSNAIHIQYITSIVDKKIN